MFCSISVVIPCSAAISICFSTLTCSRLCREALHRPIHPPRAYRKFRAACVTFVRRVDIYIHQLRTALLSRLKNILRVAYTLIACRLASPQHPAPLPQAFAVLLESTSTPSSLQVHRTPSNVALHVRPLVDQSPLTPLASAAAR